MQNIINVNTNNQDYQHIESLKNNRNQRFKIQKFFVEGVKSINLAFENNWVFDSLIYSTEQKQSDWTKDIIKKVKADKHYDLKLNLLKEISDKEETSEVMAIVNFPKYNLTKIKYNTNPLIVIVDRPSSPGNLGTIIRSCNSFKVDALIIIGHSCDIYDPKTIQASIGTIFCMPIIKLEQNNEIVDFCNSLKKKYSDIQLVGTSAKAKEYISEIDFTLPTILFIGNETNGLSYYFKQICDKLAKIPIFGKASSLNIACATSIFLYEVSKQRK